MSSFMDSFIKGFGFVEDIRDQRQMRSLREKANLRAEAADIRAEETHRMNEETVRRARELEDFKRDAAEWNALQKQGYQKYGKLLDQDPSGGAFAKAVLKDPQLGQAFLAQYRRSPAMTKILKENPNVKELAGIMPVDTPEGTKYVLGVTMNDGTRKPVTEFRGTDDNPVLVDPAMLFQGRTRELAPYGAVDYYGEAGQLEGLVPEARPAPRANLQQAAAPTALKANTPATQNANAGTAESIPLKQEPVAQPKPLEPGNADYERERYRKAVAALLDSEPEAPAQPGSAAYERERLKQATAALPTTERAAPAPGSADAERERLKRATEQLKQVPAEPTGDDVKAVGGKRNADKINVASMARPERVEKVLEKSPKPTPEKAAAAAQVNYAPPEGRTRPTKGQLVQAVILAKSGLISKDQLVRYSRTGQLDAPDLKAVDPTKDIVDMNTGETVRQGRGAAATAAQALKVNKEYYDRSIERMERRFAAGAKNGTEVQGRIGRFERIAARTPMESYGLQSYDHIENAPPRVQQLMFDAYEDMDRWNREHDGFLGMGGREVDDFTPFLAARIAGVDAEVGVEVYEAAQANSKTAGVNGKTLAYIARLAVEAVRRGEFSTPEQAVEGVAQKLLSTQ